MRKAKRFLIHITTKNSVYIIHSDYVLSLLKVNVLYKSNYSSVYRTNISNLQSLIQKNVLWHCRIHHSTRVFFPTQFLNFKHTLTRSWKEEAKSLKYNYVYLWILNTITKINRPNYLNMDLCKTGTIGHFYNTETTFYLQIKNHKKFTQANTKLVYLIEPRICLLSLLAETDSHTKHLTRSAYFEKPSALSVSLPLTNTLQTT